MPRDRSLDEFTSSPETGSDGDAQEDGGDVPEDDRPEGETQEPEAGERPDAEEETPDVDPIETTYGSSPGGEACESCGAPVQGRWRDNGGLVCADCKEW